MGEIPVSLAIALRDLLGLERAIETGTYKGGGTRALAGLFDSVTTIEISAQVFGETREGLAPLEHVTMVCGDSRRELMPLAEDPVPTLYWLDGHWSGGITGGRNAECPLLDELRAIGNGHRDDCVLIDDARLFAAAPPPPHDPAQWPTLAEVFGIFAELRPRHHVTVLHDLIIAVPVRARRAVDEFGRGPIAVPSEARNPLRIRSLGRLWRRRQNAPERIQRTSGRVKT